MEKLDYLTKLLVRKGMSLNSAISFKNTFAAFMCFIFVLYIALGNVAIRSLEDSAPKNATASEQDELTLEERMQTLRQEEAPQPEEDTFRSFARKAGILLIRIMFFVLLALTIFLNYEANILYLWFLLYGPICLILAFQAFDFGSTWSWIMLVIGLAMTISGGVMLRPLRRRAKLEKELSSNGKGNGKNKSDRNQFIL